MSFDFNIILYIVFGILPSLIWLLYYLKKDIHPESNGMIIKIFLWGAAITVPVFFVQIGLNFVLEKINIDPLITSILYWFVIIAFSEELFKYLVVKFKVLNSSHLDEPLDIMLYMVITALGFTAIENILYIFTPTGNFSFTEILNRTLILSLIRFVGATFLHTLCSAVIGYAVAISLCDEKNRRLEAGFGIIMAVVLHGAYDFFIITLDGSLKIIIPITILIILAILTSLGFEQLKKLKSVCNLESRLRDENPALYAKNKGGKC